MNVGQKLQQEMQDARRKFREFARDVRDMRSMQIRYLKGDKTVLPDARRFEHAVDKQVAEIMESTHPKQQGMF